MHPQEAEKDPGLFPIALIRHAQLQESVRLSSITLIGRQPLHEFANSLHYLDEERNSQNN
jgi:hypothetical protein